MTDISPASLRDLATDIAAEAGTLLRSYAGRTSLGVETKTSATDPVSEADHASEHLITERIVAARPDDAILGEEGIDRRGTSGLRWVVDPLDGTVNFLYGYPHWCVSIAVEDEAGPVAGVVFDPSRGELFSAARGAGATVGEVSLGVSDVPDLARSLVATGFAYDADVRADQGEMAAGLLRVARDLRRGGSAALDLAWVAAGRVDVYVEHGLNPWDWAAGMLLVEEAGGVVSRTSRGLGGRPRDGIVAGGRAAHDAVVGWLGDAST